MTLTPAPLFKLISALPLALGLVATGLVATDLAIAAPPPAPELTGELSSELSGDLSSTRWQK